MDLGLVLVVLLCLDLVDEFGASILCPVRSDISAM
jgi:hypothetical protein